MMTLRRSRFRACLTACAGLLLCSLFLLPGAHAQPSPLDGLDGDGLIAIDTEGVPHVCAGSDHDLMFLLGYQHATDRFFQMDNLRRLFSGTLAELVGSAALPSDVQFRTLGLRRAASASLTAYQQQAEAGSNALDLLQAYTDGVNAWIAQGQLPPEYGPLELTEVDEWTVVDSLTIGKGLAFGLSFDLSDIDLTILLSAYIQAGIAGGFDGVALFSEDLVRTAPFDDRVSIPGGVPPFATLKKNGTPDVSKLSPAALDPRAVELARRYRETVRPVEELQKAFEPQGTDTGSNWWLVDGEHSETGHALLANDPHLALNTPPTFYEAHLLISTPGDTSCGLGANSQQFQSVTAVTPQRPHPRGTVATPLNVSGVTFAGVPGVVQGCNERLCWGSTVHPMDVTDVYLEEVVLDPATGTPVGTRFEDTVEPVQLIPQQFFVNVLDDDPDNEVLADVGPLEGGVTVIVPRRNSGPIVAFDASDETVTGLSVQYTGWRATLEFEAFFGFLRASTPRQFRDALQFFDVGSQNWAVATVDGDIAYYTSAEMPVREDLQLLLQPDGGIPPFLIRDGTHQLRHEWLPVMNPQPQQALDYEILPYAEMPQWVNPERGYIANANNDPIGTSLDNNPLNQLRPGGGLYYLSPGYVSLRMGRIDRELMDYLAGGGKVSMDELIALQGNNQLLDAELVSPYLLTAFDRASRADAPAALGNLADDAGVTEAVGRIAAWDFSTPTGLPDGYDPSDVPGNLAPKAGEVQASIAATIWSVFRGQLVENVVDETLEEIGLGSFLPGSREAYKAVEHLLETYGAAQGVGASGIDFFAGADGLSREDARDLVILQSLREALDLLASDEFAPAFGGSSDQDDYRWGALHRIVFDHPLGGPFNIPPAAGFSPTVAGLPGLSRAGGYEAVDASSHSARADGVNEFMFGSGPSRRFVGDLDPQGIDARQVIPGGQSGILGSPHYADQLILWLTNEYHLFRLDPDDVLGAIETRRQFSPDLGPTTPCVSSPTVLCLQDGRFRLTVDWRAPQGTTGDAVVAVQSDDSGIFTFFDIENWEMLVKVLDACPVNDRFWVFIAAATNVGWTLTVEDTEAGQTRVYDNPIGDIQVPITDTNAFATCP